MDVNRDIGLGSVPLTQASSQRKALRLLHTAFDEGIRHFDTAPVYGEGYAEKILGGFIRTRRDQLTISTKCGLGQLKRLAIPPAIALPLNALRKGLRGKRPPPAAINTRPEPLPARTLSRAYVEKSLTASLHNLQTDYIDFYLLHEALPAFLSPEARSFLAECQQKGIIRKLGIAAAYVNLLPLTGDDLSGWDILQYEHGLHYPTEDLCRRWPDKTHFYHSTLKFLRALPVTNYSSAEWAGILLNIAAKNNPSGKVLFSSSRPETIRGNMKAYTRFSHFQRTELNDIVHAVYRS
jgi:hypothetical protein